MIQCDPPALKALVKVRQARVVYPPAERPSIQILSGSAFPVEIRYLTPEQQSSISNTPHLKEPNKVSHVNKNITQTSKKKKKVRIINLAFIY